MNRNSSPSTPLTPLDNLTSADEVTNNSSPLQENGELFRPEDEYTTKKQPILTKPKKPKFAWTTLPWLVRWKEQRKMPRVSTKTSLTREMGTLYSPTLLLPTKLQTFLHPYKKTANFSDRRMNIYQYSQSRGRKGHQRQNWTWFTARGVGKTQWSHCLLSAILHTTRAEVLGRARTWWGLWGWNSQWEKLRY